MGNRFEKYKEKGGMRVPERLREKVKELEDVLHSDGMVMLVLMVTRIDSEGHQSYFAPLWNPELGEEGEKEFAQFFVEYFSKYHERNK